MPWPFSSWSANSDEAGPSSSSGTTEPQPQISSYASTPPPPTLSKFDSVLEDEAKYQELQYPTFEDVPGCMRLLDEFLMCYALVPQLRNMYRHGELRDCTWKWEDFKYCLSLKSEDTEVRRDLWVKRRAEWWARRRVGGSSEDVWDVRKEKLENFPPLGEEVTSETSTT